MNLGRFRWTLGFWCVMGAVLLVGCAAGGGGGGEPATGGEGEGEGEGEPQGAGALNGQVATVAGEPIAGVAVTLNNGRSASTDDNGFYSFGDLEPGAEVIAGFRKSGFASTTKAFTVVESTGATPGCVIMAAAAETVTFDATTSSTQRSGDSAVSIEAGSLVDASGTPVAGEVELTATFIDPSTDSIMAFPGSFETAQTEGGETVTLESFGFAIYELSQDGEDLQLAPGSTAEIEYVLPENAQSGFTVGDTIPLWEFDEETATWMEAGTGDIREASDGSGRLAWFATVDHFSAWNCDAPLEEKQCIVGTVTADGIPVGGADVAAVGMTYNGTSTTRTASDGTFCVEVKRGSTVRVEVRLNGAAAPVATVTVTVPDTPADCSTDECMILDDDLSVSFDSCVMGFVLNEDGSPAAGVTVYVVPGETVITEADGSYCAQTISDAEVYVFADGRPSVSVMTPPIADCIAEDCAEADLTLTLPEAGDVVGNLMAAKSVNYSGFSFPGSEEVESFTLFGAFFMADFDELNQFTIFGFDTQTEQIGECSVTTQSFSATFDDTTDFTSFLNLGGIGALDPGEPGRADVAATGVDLLRGDPNESDPPVPFLSGLFLPEEDSEALVAMGFGAGQTVSFSFPGGTDIGAFNTSIDVPADLDVTSPDMADPDLSLDFNSALGLAWNADQPADNVLVTIMTQTSEFDLDTNTVSGDTATAICEFPDTGSATVPAEVMSRLSGEADSTSLSVARRRQAEVDVPLNSVSGTGIVTVVGSTEVRSAIVSGTDGGISDPCAAVTCPAGTTCDPGTLQCCDDDTGECAAPDFDPCDFIPPCAEGTVCNPDTLQCDPV